MGPVEHGSIAKAGHTCRSSTLTLPPTALAFSGEFICWGRYGGIVEAFLMLEDRGALNPPPPPKPPSSSPFLTTPTPELQRTADSEQDQAGADEKGTRDIATGLLEAEASVEGGGGGSGPGAAAEVGGTGLEDRGQKAGRRRRWMSEVSFGCCYCWGRPTSSGSPRVASSARVLVPAAVMLAMLAMLLLCVVGVRIPPRRLLKLCR